jgi:hypothetical protein
MPSSREASKPKSLKSNVEKFIYDKMVHLNDKVTKNN